MSHPETINDVLSKLEPDSSYDGCRHDPGFLAHNQAVLSIAISLRRIADALSDETGAATNLIQHLGWEAGRAFEQGRRTDR